MTNTALKPLSVEVIKICAESKNNCEMAVNLILLRNLSEL